MRTRLYKVEVGSPPLAPSHSAWSLSHHPWAHRLPIWNPLLSGVFFLRPLALEVSPKNVALRVTVANKSFEVRSNASGSGSNELHCSGALKRGGAVSWPHVHYESARGATCARSADIAATYDRLHEQGLQYGPGYRTLENAWASMGDGAMAMARLLARSTQQATIVHPADLDDALCLDQLLSIGGESGETRLPFAVDDVRLQAASSSELWGVCVPPESTRSSHAKSARDCPTTTRHSALTLRSVPMLWCRLW
jgi:hypothetical protein